MSTPRTDAIEARRVTRESTHSETWNDLLRCARQLETKLNAKNAEGSREVSDGGNDADKDGHPSASEPVYRISDKAPEFPCWVWVSNNVWYNGWNRMDVEMWNEAMRIQKLMVNPTHFLFWTASKEKPAIDPQPAAMTAETELRELRKENVRLKECLTASNYGDVPKGWDDAILRAEKAEQQRDSLKAEHQELQAREQKLVEALKSEKERLKGDLEDEKRCAIGLGREVKTLESDCGLIQRELLSSNEELTAAKIECVNCKKQISTLREELTRVTDELADLIKDEHDDPSAGITGWSSLHQSVTDARAALSPQPTHEGTKTL